MKTKHVSRRFRRFLWANEAATAIEYAVLIGVVVVGSAAAIALFFDQIETAIGTIGGDPSDERG